MKRRKYYWALTGCWYGSVCAIIRGNNVPPFARWRQIPKKEWLELRAEGFYTRQGPTRPVAYLDKLDREEQKLEPYDWHD